MSRLFSFLFFFALLSIPQIFALQEDEFNESDVGAFWEQFQEHLITSREIITDSPGLPSGAPTGTKEFKVTCPSPATEWYEGVRGYGLFQDHTGPFDIQTRVRTRRADDSGTSNQSFVFGGIIIYNPSSGDYIFNVVGNRNTGDNVPNSLFAVETKRTINNDSSQNGYGISAPRAQLRMVRDSNGTVTVYSRDWDADPSEPWVERPYPAFGTPNLGNVNSDSVKIGIISYGYINYGDDFASFFDYFRTSDSPSEDVTIQNFDASPSNILENSGTSVTLSWNTANATSVSIDQGIGSVALDGTISVSPNVTTTYTLTADDGENTVTETVTVTVAPNQNPIANAGADFSVTEGSLATLDGSASSDPDSLPNPLTYSWTQTSGPTSVSLNNSDQAIADFSTLVLGTDYIFELTVSDGELSATDSITVSVIAAPAVTLPNEIVSVSPIPESSGIQTDGLVLEINTTLNLFIDQWTNGTIDIHRMDDDSLVYSYNPTSSDLIEARKAHIPVNISLDEGTTYYVVNDGKWAHLNEAPWPNWSKDIEKGAWVFTTETGVVLPLVDSFEANPPTILVDSGAPVTLSWESSNATSASIDQGIGFVAVDGSLIVTPNITTTYTLTVDDGSNTSTQSVTVTVVTSNSAPIANAGSDQTSQVGALVSLDGNGSSDPDQLPNPITYSWTQTAGSTLISLSDATSSQPTFTAPSVVGSEEYTFELTVSDGDLSASDSITITINDIPPVPLPDQIASIIPAHNATGIVTDGLVLEINTTLNLFIDQWTTGTIDIHRMDDDSLVYSYDPDASDLVEVRKAHIPVNISLDPDTTYYVVNDGKWAHLNEAPWPNWSSDILKGAWVFTTESGDPIATIDNFEANPSSIDENSGTQVTLSWNTTDATSVNIDQGIGNVALDGSIIVTPNTTTTYTLSATDGQNNATQSVTVTVIPNQAPSANAGADISTGENDLVQFDGSLSTDADGTISSYDWDFGDGNNATGINPTHTYSNSGTYTVSLTVTDDDGASSSDSLSVNVAANQAPIANVGSDLNAGVGDSILFDASSSSDSDGSIVSYSWDFGDGNNGTGINPNHTFSVPGSYTVTLTVTDDDGAISSDTLNVSVTVNQAPIANAGTDFNTDEDIIVNFDGSGSSDSDGSIVSYSWDFGDGNNGTGINPNHTFSDPGSYTVTLTVTDDDGSTSTHTITVTVTDATDPIVSIASIFLKGSTDGTGSPVVSVTVDGQAATIIGSQWEREVNVVPGNNSFNVTVEDAEGNTSTTTVQFNF